MKASWAVSVVVSILILGTLGLSQEANATKDIRDDFTGGDCNLIGIWDSASKTCTLTTDLNEEIRIGSSDITLDGNFHTLTGPGSPNTAGVSALSSGATIKNFVIKDFLVGILFTDDSNLATNNLLDGNFHGFQISGQGPLGGDTIVKRNTISNSLSNSFRLVNTNGNQVFENNFLSNERKGTVTSSHSNIFFLPSPLGGNYYENEGLANQLTCTVIEGLFCVGPNEEMVFGTDSLTGLAVLDERPYASLLETIVFPDTDGDGVLDNVDNCPNDPNEDQVDGNNNGLGDVCDPETLLIAQLQEENDALNDLIESLQAQIQSLLDIIASFEAILQSGEITICHHDETKIISLGSLGGHLGHGDTIGACEP